MGIDRGSVSVAVVGDAQMMRLHHQFSGELGTTDVLTFDLHDEPGPMEGEIVVCFDEACRQAREHGHAPDQETLLYVVHGLLHLLGYDDRDAASARGMHEREDQVLTAIGVGPLYSRDAVRHQP